MYKAWEWQRGGFGKPCVCEHHVLQADPGGKVCPLECRLLYDLQG